MKKRLQLIVFVFCLAPFLILAQGTEPHYNPTTGATYYPNGTVYLPAQHGSNQTDSPIVLTQDSESSDYGVSSTTRTKIDCKENPDACRQALQEAADSGEEWAAGSGANENSSSFSMGTHGEQEFNKWLGSKGTWPSFPPIFFPGTGGRGIPLTTVKAIHTHTRTLGRSIR